MSLTTPTTSYHSFFGPGLLMRFTYRIFVRPKLSGHRVVHDQYFWSISQIPIVENASPQQTHSVSVKITTACGLEEHFGILIRRRFGLALNDERITAVETKYRLGTTDRNLPHAGKVCSRFSNSDKKATRCGSLVYFSPRKLICAVTSPSTRQPGSELINLCRPRRNRLPPPAIPSRMRLHQLLVCAATCVASDSPSSRARFRVVPD